jgi:hypothetical protein
MINVLPSNNSNLVYADWLEEYGNDIVKANAVRAGLYVLENVSYDEMERETGLTCIIYSCPKETDCSSGDNQCHGRGSLETSANDGRGIAAG